MQSTFDHGWTSPFINILTCIKTVVPVLTYYNHVEKSIDKIIRMVRFSKKFRLALSPKTLTFIIAMFFGFATYFCIFNLFKAQN
jgi:hypothetical protein